MSAIGIVIIGRNEGERLKRCVASIPDGLRKVYVDSGSCDGSVNWAQIQGLAVVELDMSRHFSAARARNAGLKQLLELEPAVDFVQFVDGDCELLPGWLERAAGELSQESRLAAVCGRLRERHPETSIYNRLCDMEWNGPIGEIAACGGVAMYRVSAFRAVDGFNPSVVAGEEPELCLRLRNRGWGIRRIDAEMALHDAAMTRFGQWWKRAVRSGHSYLNGMLLHGAQPGHHNVRQVLSIIFWGVFLPSVAIASGLATRGLGLLVLLAYVVLWNRVRSHRLRNGESRRNARLYATFCVIAKFPQALGIVQHLWVRFIVRRSQTIIEHKDPSAANLQPQRA